MTQTDNRITGVRFDEQKLWLTLADGRNFSEPIKRHIRLEKATPEQRLRLRLLRAHGFLMKGKSEPAIRELRQIQQETKDPEMLFWTGSLLVNTYALTRKFEDGLTTLNDILPLATKVEKKDVAGTSIAC